MSAINYSKWDHIEISDDEDDTHPNVDTASLFRWRHEARLQREAEEKAAKAKRVAESKLRQQQMKELRERLDKVKVEAAASEASDAQVKGIQMELAELEQQEAGFKSKEAELERMEREHPHWNVDNISQDKQSKTLINKEAVKPKPAPSNDDEMIKDMNEFFKKYEKEIKGFGFLKDYNESHKYLREHMHLVCDHLASYLVVWCVDLQVEEKTDLMKRVAHQTIVIQYIMELAKTLKRDPRDCVDAFFTRMATAEPEYHASFLDELQSFIKRVEGRAQARLEEALKKQEEEDRKARLGPGGLDPIEVLESLPPKIKKAFEDQNTPLLQEGFSELSKEDFQYHFKRCVDSGLWVPNKGDADEDADAEEEEEEEEFEEVDEDAGAGEADQ